jgi:hypothetical protein
MVMYQQSKRLSQPLQWGRRERTIIAIVLSCTALAAAALLAYGLTSGAPQRKDCIDVVFASTLGGADLRGCGAQAKRICATGGTFHSIRPELEAACRKAGFAFIG